MLPNTGKVLRVATARPTIDKPLARFSCRQETFIIASSSDSGYVHSIGASARIVNCPGGTRFDRVGCVEYTLPR